jgi:hypothetical protein
MAHIKWSKVSINIFICFQMSYTTKLHGILIFVHLWSRSSWCWLCYIILTQNDLERSRNKDQSWHSIQGLKTDFRCHGHDLRSIKNSQTLFRTEFFYDNNWQIHGHLNPEIKFGPIIFFIKEALQVFWVQRYGLLSQINYHNYL